MSGPVDQTDAPPVEEHGTPTPPAVELFESRTSRVGDLDVRRALPRRGHRTVGAWCFADHMGPASVTEDRGVDIGPHPHIGLQTVTWLVAGEILHRDSLGSEQVVRAGQLNLMTAGAGVAHAEEATGRYRGELHGIQLWVAQPEATRHGPPAFEHHPDLPVVELDGGTAIVVVGDFAATPSPARRDTDHVGVDLSLRPGRTTAPLRADHEHALVVLDGSVRIEGVVVEPGHLAYLGTDRDELVVEVAVDARAMLLGGVPFPDEILMWWNYVARTADEVEAANDAWNTGDERFGPGPLASRAHPRPPDTAVDRPPARDLIRRPGTSALSSDGPRTGHEAATGHRNVAAAASTWSRNRARSAESWMWRLSTPFSMPTEPSISSRTMSAWPA